MGENELNYKYNNKQIKDLWDDMAEGFFNYGRISPLDDISNIPDLVKANHDMVDYLIEKLDITQDSHILDLGCGPGMYTVTIAQKTGCRFVGTDISVAYLEQAEILAERKGVAEKGYFIKSSWEDVNPDIKSAKFTHILALGSMYYGHSILKKIFKDLAEWSNHETKIFIWDFIRKSPWSECEMAQKHIKMKHPIASLAEVFEQLKRSDLELYDFEDFTQYIIPGNKILIRECKARDPEMKVLTFPHVSQAFMEDKIAYVHYYLRLRTQ